MGRRRPPRLRHVPTPEGRAFLLAEYPEKLRQLAYIASKGGVRGPKRCLVCQKPGAFTRLHISPDALRLDHPTIDQVRCYWLCARCGHDEPAAEVIAAALQRRPR